MAPVCSDPRQFVITLNPAQRRELLKLVDDVTRHMLSQLENSSGELGPVQPESEPGVETAKQPTEQQSVDAPDSNETGQTLANISGETSSGTSTPKTQKPQPPKEENRAKSAVSSARSVFEPSKKPEAIQQAAIKHMKEWRKEFMPRLEEIALVEDDEKIRTERRKRLETLEKSPVSTAEQDAELSIDIGGPIDKSEDFFSLQLLYEPIQNRLAGSLSERDRREALSCVLLLLLSTGKYSAHSRTLILFLASSLELPQSFVIREEMEIASSLMESSSKADKEDDGSGGQKRREVMNAEAEAAKRQKDNKFSRYWKVGLASVAGAAVIGITGGLAAPLVAGALGGVLGGIGLGGVASFLGIFWMNGVLVGALFGAFGAKMTGEMMDKYAKEIEDFKFIPLRESPDSEGGSIDAEEAAKQHPQDRRLRVTIGINGWLNTEDDVTRPWRVLSTETEVFALRYELKALMALGTAFKDLTKSAATNVLKSEIIKRTALATLWAALWPIQVLSAASNVDNPFNHASNRSRKAGELLADALINRVQGERPVTLIGYSNGASAVHACLQSLADRRAFGIIDTVVLMGAPAPASPAHWRTLRSVVSGRIFNVYSENDMILSLVYRMHSMSLGVAGLQAIKEVAGVENLDLSEVVSGHLRYPDLTGEIIRKCGFVGIDAHKEIEEDELIRMKHDYAEGKITDAQLESGFTRNSGEETSPALPQRPSTEGPALPRRPVGSDVQRKPIPRRPVGAPKQPSTFGGQESDDEKGRIFMVDNDRE